MLRKIRIILALLSAAMLTLLFLDFTGTAYLWFGWLAKIQFLPAILALNVAVVGALVLATLLFGRIYCSIICPLGVFQDAISWISGKFQKNRFSYSKNLMMIRTLLLVAFVTLWIAGFNSIYVLVAPYSAYGRMVSSLAGPFYKYANNLMAYFAQRAGSYAFYSVEVQFAGIGVLVVAGVTFVALVILAWKNGRTYCNTICPVGTVLGALSTISYFKPHINSDLCSHCGLCAKNCKASCIDSTSEKIDYSRCVACMDCLGKCHKGALTYSFRNKQLKPTENKPVVSADIGISNIKKDVSDAGASRRSFMTVFGLFALTTAARAQEKKFDGGLAIIEDKKIPDRAAPLSPAGSLGKQNLKSHCTACQLCISVCPNHVLQPSTQLAAFMQPEMSYEKGYCRPECVKCSEVCPTGAIMRITTAEKSSIQIGHAVWSFDRCVVNRDNVNCGNCARHCPSGAITMVAREAGNPASRKIPMIDENRCIGCGACEYVCPSRPLSAIYVDGHERHKII